MTITEIVYLVLIGLTILLSIVPPIIKFFVKRKTQDTSEVDTQKITDNGEEISNTNTTSTQDNKSTIENIFGKFEKIIDYIMSAEKLFGGISLGKTGSLKLSDVLQKIKVDCLTNGENYDENYYTEIVNKIVSIMNINKN